MAKARKKSRNIVLIIAVLFFLGYAVVSLVMSQMSINQKKEENAQLQAQIEQEKLEIEELDYLLRSGGDQDYIERVAREKLGYISPNERVFIDISGK